MNMINVDFNDLKRTNPDVVSWVKVNGTNNNCPFVQVNDNKYYLTHSFNKSYNAAGWVFLATKNVEKKWTTRYPNWEMIYNELNILYPERLNWSLKIIQFMLLLW